MEVIFLVIHDFSTVCWWANWTQEVEQSVQKAGIEKKPMHVTFFMQIIKFDQTSAVTTLTGSGLKTKVHRMAIILKAGVLLLKLK